MRAYQHLLTTSSSSATRLLGLPIGPMLARTDRPAKRRSTRWICSRSIHTWVAHHIGIVVVGIASTGLCIVSGLGGGGIVEDGPTCTGGRGRGAAGCWEAAGPGRFVLICEEGLVEPINKEFSMGDL